MSKAIVTIPNDSFWLERDIISISDDRYAVIYRADVRAATVEEEHLVVRAIPHSIDQAELGAINRNLRERNAEAVISFVVADREGWAQVITVPEEEFNLFNLAAAISVIKASCGWDESLPIMVVVNSAEVRIWPRFDGQHWVADDRE